MKGAGSAGAALVIEQIQVLRKDMYYVSACIDSEMI